MIDPEAAARALGAVTDSRRRASALRGYARAGDSLVGWGLTWVVGNLTAQFAPGRAPTVWPAVLILAIAWSLLCRSRKADSRICASALAAVVLAGWFVWPAWLRCASQ